MTGGFPRNHWYVAALAEEVGDGLFARTVMSQPLLLVRNAAGRPVALEDRCIHRRVSLSLGTRIGERIRCGYHGLEFDLTGACVRIPGQDVIPPGARVRAYPVVEQDGLVWIWPGDPARADRRTVPRYAMCSDPAFAGRTMSVHLSANARLLVDNVLDLSHIAFVHLKTVGSSYVADHRAETRVQEDVVEVTRVMNGVENPPLYKRALGFDVGDRVQRIRYWPAGNLELHITIAPAGRRERGQIRNLRVLSPVTPEHDGSHFQFFGMYRDFDIDDGELTAYIADQFMATILEDKAIIEDQQRNLDRDPPDTPSLSTAADKGPLAARRILKRLAEADEASSA